MSAHSNWGYPQTARSLFILAGIFSIVASIAFYLRPSALEDTIKLTMTILLLGNAFILVGFGWMLGKNPPRLILPALAFLALSMFLFVFDDFGAADMLVLMYYVAMFAVCAKLFLLSRRKST